MRWKKWVGGLALLLATSAGCKQQVFMTAADYQESKELAITGLENNPRAVDKPLTDLVGAPSRVSDPERPERQLSLAEAISIALEQGSTGPQQVPLAGLGDTIVGESFSVDQLGTFSGRFNGSNDSIKVLRLDPAIAGASIESAISKFDAVWSNSLTWNTTDRPVGTALDTFQAANQTNAIQTQNASLSTALIKPLSTGGVAGITFDNNYTFTNLPSRVNPSYQPNLQFSFEQPLLQGFGTEINQLRPTSPGSLLHPGTFNTQPTAEGILVTRLRYDQARAEFERNVHFMVLNVELAYWNLYYGYWNLYAQETGLRLAYEAFRIFNARYQAGKVNIADLSQTRGQYELFRAQRLQALNQVLDYERSLRSLLGLPIEDGTRLVPSDQPTLAPFTPDWSSSLQEGLTLKPELIIARQEVKAAEMNLIVARDSERPDIRFTATYDFNSIGTRLDGPNQDNAFRSLSSGKFSDWSVGLQGNIPIGFRDAHAKARIAKLQLARSYEIVRDQELKLQRYMARIYRSLDYSYNQIKIYRAQREAYGAQIRALSEQIKVGTQTPDILLEAQRFYTQALTAEYSYIATYNQSLIGWEFTKGTILTHDNVVIGEGGLPSAAQGRAVEHQRERTKALVLRERATPIHCDTMDAAGTEGVLPQIPQTSAGSLPALMSETRALPPAPELPQGAPILMPKQTGKLSNMNDFKSNTPLSLPPAGIVAPASKEVKKPLDAGFTPLATTEKTVQTLPDLATTPAAPAAAANGPMLPPIGKPGL